MKENDLALVIRETNLNLKMKNKKKVGKKKELFYKFYLFDYIEFQRPCLYYLPPIWSITSIIAIFIF